MVEDAYGVELFGQFLDLSSERGVGLVGVGDVSVGSLEQLLEFGDSSDELAAIDRVLRAGAAKVAGQPTVIDELWIPTGAEQVTPPA